jgi:hypothetical protein
VTVYTELSNEIIILRSLYHRGITFLKNNLQFSTKNWNYIFTTEVLLSFKTIYDYLPGTPSTTSTWEVLSTTVLWHKLKHQTLLLMHKQQSAEGNKRYTFTKYEANKVSFYFVLNAFLHWACSMLPFGHKFNDSLLKENSVYKLKCTQ